MTSKFYKIKQEFEENVQIFEERKKIFEERFNKFQQLNSEIQELIFRKNLNNKQITLIEKQDDLKTQKNIKKHLEKQLKYSSCKEFSLLNQKMKQE